VNTRRKRYYPATYYPISKCPVVVHEPAACEDDKMRSIHLSRPHSRSNIDPCYIVTVRLVLRRARSQAMVGQKKRSRYCGSNRGRPGILIAPVPLGEVVRYARPWRSAGDSALPRMTEGLFFCSEGLVTADFILGEEKNQAFESKIRDA
jgi:hypothetical protein